MIVQSIAELDFTTLAAGTAAAIFVFSVGQVAFGGLEQKNYRRRMSAVKGDRFQMKAALLAAKVAKEKDERNAKIMRDALLKLKLEKQLDNKSLKLRLARAGFRQNKQQMVFLLCQILLPVVFAIFATIFFHLFIEMPNKNFTMYLCAGVGGAIVGYLLPGMRIDGIAQARLRALEQSLPDVVDLLTICVESGMPIEQGLNRVVQELGGSASVLAEEIDLLGAELSYLGDRNLAYDNFIKRTNSQTVKTMVSAITQAERYGTSIGKALRVISSESRFRRMSMAETKAAALPAKLTVPMMVFFVPGLFVVILGPAVLDIMGRF
jgi:tight adherence protein C